VRLESSWLGNRGELGRERVALGKLDTVRVVAREVLD
jgi:hypothetical protein